MIHKCAKVQNRLLARKMTTIPAFEDCPEVPFITEIDFNLIDAPNFNAKFYNDFKKVFGVSVNYTRVPSRFYSGDLYRIISNVTEHVKKIFGLEGISTNGEFGRIVSIFYVLEVSRQIMKRQSIKDSSIFKKIVSVCYPAFYERFDFKRAMFETEATVPEPIEPTVKRIMIEKGILAPHYRMPVGTTIMLTSTISGTNAMYRVEFTGETECKVDKLDESGMNTFVTSYELLLVPASISFGDSAKYSGTAVYNDGMLTLLVRKLFGKFDFSYPVDAKNCVIYY